MSDIAILPPDGSWADPLSRKERRELARKLANPAPRNRRRGYDPMTGRMARRLASAEMSDLHLDVTERAKVAAS